MFTEVGGHVWDSPRKPVLGRGLGLRVRSPGELARL